MRFIIYCLLFIAFTVFYYTTIENDN